MLKNDKYQIETDYGVVTVWHLEERRPYCTLSLSNKIVLDPSGNHVSGQMVLPAPELLKAKQFVIETNRIIERLFELIGRIPMRNHGALLDLGLRGGRAAIELLETNPALGLLLAQKNYYDPAKRRIEDSRDLVCRNRKRILEYCVYPGAKRAVKFLAKIPIEICTLELVNDLKKIIIENDSGQMRILSHLPRISKLVVDVMIHMDKYRLVATSFYKSASTYPLTDSDIDAEYLLDEIVRLTDWHTEMPRRLIRSVADLQSAHDYFAEENSLRFYKRTLALIFTKPPIPGIEHIIEDNRIGIFPLRNGMELYKEGKRMHNCIASYANDIHENSGDYAYHVRTLMEDATLLIARHGKKWSIAEICGVCNANISVKTREYVQKWLNKFNATLRMKKLRESKSGVRED